MTIMEWKNKEIDKLKIYYRNYIKGKETRTFIISKDENNNFNLFISNKDVLKNIEKDIYSINLSKLAHIPLNIVKENDFIKDFLQDEYYEFVDYTIKMQLSLEELEITIKEMEEEELIDNILIKNRQIKTEVQDKKEKIIKQSLLSNIISKIINKIVKKNKLTSIFK